MDDWHAHSPEAAAGATEGREAGAARERIGGRRWAELGNH